MEPENDGLEDDFPLQLGCIIYSFLSRDLVFKPSQCPSGSKEKGGFPRAVGFGFLNLRE